MDLLSQALTILLFPFFYVLHSGSQYYVPTYVGAGLTAALFFVSWRRGRNPTARRIARFVFPARFYRNPSTMLDLKLVVFGLYFITLQGLLVYFLVPQSAGWSATLLERLLGPGTVAGTPSLAISVATAFLSFLAVEFGYWFSHYLMHRLPWLWEFHKVHHSAEVLTPLTEWRQHPVELMLFPLLMGAVNAIVVAPVIWYFGPKALVLSLGTANVFYMVFWYTILHLRHSHVPIIATGWLGRLLQTPAHHQIHHSTDPKHFDTNLGYCLSLWDWVFGTLYMPEKGQKITYGLGHKDTPLETVVGSILAPFGRAATIVMAQVRWRKPRLTASPPAE